MTVLFETETTIMQDGGTASYSVNITGLSLPTARDGVSAITFTTTLTSATAAATTRAISSGTATATLATPIVELGTATSGAVHASVTTAKAADATDSGTSGTLTGTSRTSTTSLTQSSTAITYAEATISGIAEGPPGTISVLVAVLASSGVLLACLRHNMRKRAGKTFEGGGSKGKGKALPWPCSGAGKQDPGALPHLEIITLRDGPSDAVELTSEDSGVDFDLGEIEALADGMPFEATALTLQADSLQAVDDDKISSLSYGEWGDSAGDDESEYLEMVIDGDTIPIESPRLLDDVPLNRFQASHLSFGHSLDALGEGPRRDSASFDRESETSDVSSNVTFGDESDHLEDRAIRIATPLAGNNNDRRVNDSFDFACTMVL
jgi:hypothetical protein